jgi:hypothetical protein
MKPEAMVEIDRSRTVGQSIRIPSALQALLMLSLVKLLLKIRGYGGTIQWIRHRVSSVSRLTPVDLEGVTRAEHAIAIAGALYPGRALCLEQSLALYYLLRRQGVGVKYCQGVIPHPFEAHAWVEYGGDVINDVAEHARLFARLPEQLP